MLLWGEKVFINFTPKEDCPIKLFLPIIITQHLVVPWVYSDSWGE